MNEQGPSHPKEDEVGVKLEALQGDNLDAALTNAELTPEGKRELEEALEGKEGTDIFEIARRLNQIRLLHVLAEYQESFLDLQDAQANPNNDPDKAASVEFLQRLYEKRRDAQRAEVEDLRHRLAS